ncbi:cytochrome c6, chloroplastic isoform X1 [Lycium ferocissimum]|uniref:cytochrome c6, chloroplastic isoform X1 n=1 Tax=Lycium ferocissimum TaxID=112874 RepID=UPI0028155516|nr:cytochrome c6, chloroplastic isoform X1 [Lycium ferocissimum]
MAVFCLMPSSLANSSSLKLFATPTKYISSFDCLQKLAQKDDKLPCELKLLKSLAPPLMTALIALSPIVNPPVSIGQTIDVQKGAALFNRACIGCHYAGGNIIQPGATLFLKDLQRNGVDAEDEIYRITYYGKGRMPGFGQNCTPRGQCTFGPRLQEDEIQLLAEFVKSQADKGWPKIENNGD